MVEHDSRVVAFGNRLFVGLTDEPHFERNSSAFWLGGRVVIPQPHHQLKKPVDARCIELGVVSPQAVGYIEGLRPELVTALFGCE